jgi:nucleoside-diphosphate-sugar epimerase
LPERDSLVMKRLPARDLAEVSERVGAAWRALAGGHVLVTGAAGFVGSWMVESLLHASEEHSLNVTITALVRNGAAFRQRFPFLVASHAVHVLEADVRTFHAPTPPTHIVHAASASSTTRPGFNPDDIIETIERGTGRALELARESRSRRVLIVSSGSVYDRRQPGAARINEEHATLDRGDSLAERFGASKRAAERTAMGADVDACIARIFAVHGPRLPLDGQFAVGQFLADALAARAIRMSGDGSPVRTYLYAADMAAWCWTILLRGQPRRAYNVGAEREHTIAEVAERVSCLSPQGLKVERGLSTGSLRADRFVPDTSRARDELGLEAWTGFESGLARTWQWLGRDPA